MKLRNISLFAVFTALCAKGIQAEGNPFAPKNNPLPSPITSIPMSSHEQIATPSSSMRVSAEPTNLEDHVAPLNPFAQEHHTTGEDHVAPLNPFAQEHHATGEDHTIDHHVMEPEHHEQTEPIHQGHVSTAQQTNSIKTVHITPGHSAALEPIAIIHGIEAERYFIQDKKYESYLSSHRDNAKRMYNVTIPATIHVGSFTVFKVQGMGGIPDHLDPMYHVEIQGNTHLQVGIGTQYSEPQGSALEKLTQLEDKYLAKMQTQFKAFTKEVHELISTAHQNGESLVTAKLPVAQIIKTKEPLQLTIGESHIAASFTGGSVQSSNPAIVSAVLKFDGTKTHPEWKLILTGNMAGKAIITYSSGSKSTLQPVTVIEKSSTHKSSEHKMIEKESDVNSEHSVKPSSKKESHALPAHETNEEEPEGKTDAVTKENSEEIDAKTANRFMDEDKPFSSFLKENHEEEDASHDEESSDTSHETKEVTDDVDPDEERTEGQEEDK